MYMHFPRFFFITLSSYCIYLISMRSYQNKQARQMVKSFRQEDVESQLHQIENILNSGGENIFEPGKNVEFNSEYSADQMVYKFEQEEKEL
mmetsp:Transcript_5084/g.8665  ORF Transcript_5084/g.8665 Transcript_5084/m.8665 type:complete len:91 (-) Transcript_5084:112-384(-)